MIPRDIVVMFLNAELTSDMENMQIFQVVLHCFLSLFKMVNVAKKGGFSWAVSFTSLCINLL